MSQRLWDAITDGDLDAVSKFLAEGDDPNLPNPKKLGARSLHLAIRSGSFELEKRLKIIKILINNGADINLFDNAHRNTPVRYAVADNLYEIVDLMVSASPYFDITIRDSTGSTLLHQAAWSNGVQIAQLLIERGSEVNSLNPWRETPAHRAAWRGHRQVLDVLLAHGSLQDVFIATAIGNNSVLDEYLRSGGDSNAWHGRDEQGFTLLYYAAANNQTKTASILLNYGANPNQECDQGGYPLLIAAEKGCIEMVTLLLDHGAKLTVCSDWGSGALEHAVIGGHPSMVELLIQKGLSPNGSTHSWATPLKLAQKYQNSAVIKVLLQYGASTD